jgi:hypothetical protein
MVWTGQNHRPWFTSFFCVASRRWVGAGSGGVAHRVSGAIGQPARGIGILALGIGSAVPLASRHNGGISSRRWERGRHRVSCAIGQPERRWCRHRASVQRCHWPAGTKVVSASRRWERRGGIGSLLMVDCHVFLQFLTHCLFLYCFISSPTAAACGMADEGARLDGAEAGEGGAALFVW